MVSKAFLGLLSLPLLVSAHFTLVYPPSRDADTENQAAFPCGGHSQTQTRTTVSLASFLISLDLEHTESLISIFLALGTEVGESFNYELLPTISETGPGAFCLPEIVLPTDLNITDGTNGTIQVVTNAHSGGGLYACADIRFSIAIPAIGIPCTNNTGVTANPVPASDYAFANETAPHEGDEHGEASSSTTDSTVSATTSKGTAASATATDVGIAQNVGWVLLGGAFLGGVVLL